MLVEDPSTREQRFARVKVPPLLPRFVPLNGGSRFVVLEQLIAANLPEALSPHGDRAPSRLPGHANADLDLEESEADDLLAAVETELRRRRFGRGSGWRSTTTCRRRPRTRLAELELGADDVYESSAPLGLGQLWALHAIDRSDLHESPWVPRTQPRLATAGDGPVDLFSVLRERSVLVHHPYDSFTTSVEAFITQAADDPNVLAIKQTLYRTSDDTAIVSALVRAAEQGKQVAALVEVKARFDEQANIVWARQLERAGVHVVYGLVGLKTHSKIVLVVRREEDGLRRYCHIGTGNYNSETAKVYEDIGLLTADPAIGEDLTDLFNHLTGYGRPVTHRRIVVAPQGMRPWVLGQIAEEAAAGEAGRITIKVNGLTDPEVIDALYAASRSGVRVDLSVRGVCCLRPGVPGLSDRITVRCVMGRFLEHSRIFRFGDPGGERQVRYTIGSGDLMERNLDRRIEVLVPVLDRSSRPARGDPPAQPRRRHECLGIGTGRDLEAGGARARTERSTAAPGARVERAGGAVRRSHSAELRPCGSPRWTWAATHSTYWWSKLGATEVSSRSHERRCAPRRRGRPGGRLDRGGDRGRDQDVRGSRRSWTCSIMTRSLPWRPRRCARPKRSRGCRTNQAPPVSRSRSSAASARRSCFRGGPRERAHRSGSGPLR